MTTYTVINDSLWKPPPFKNGEYDWWVEQFESHVCSVIGKMWKVIEFEGERIMDKTDNTKEKDRSLYNDRDYKILELNSRAKKVIHMALGSSNLRKVLRYKTAHEIWEALKRMYGGNEDAKKNRILAVLQDYDNATQGKDESL